MNVSCIRLFAFYIVAVVTTISCAGTPSTAGDYPPVLPPVDSMQMQISNLYFDSTATDSNSHESHYSRAFRLLTTIDDDIRKLELPKSILAAAHDADPKLNEENQWEWKYTQRLDGNKFPIRLVASRKKENKIHWEFYLVNSQLGLKDQLLIQGHSNTEGTRGEWIVYRFNSEGKEKARLEWVKRRESNTYKKLDIKSARAGEGNTVEYTYDGKRETVIFHKADKKQAVEIQQNIGSKVGYIFSPSYNQGEQACWDKSYTDISCSEV